jgi:hypothetical protein
VLVQRRDGSKHRFRPLKGNTFDVCEARQLAIAPGERLLLRANCGDLLNGQLVTVKSIHGDGSLSLTDGRSVPAGYRKFCHGYAVTSHASQGKTVDEVLVVASSVSFPAVNREQFYVSISRGRERCTIFTDDKQLLQERVGRSRERKAALELQQLKDANDEGRGSPEAAFARFGGRSGSSRARRGQQPSGPAHARHAPHAQPAALPLQPDRGAFPFLDMQGPRGARHPDGGSGADPLPHAQADSRTARPDRRGSGTAGTTTPTPARTGTRIFTMNTPQPQQAPSVQEHSGQSLFLEAVTRQGRVHGFPLAQLVHYLLEANPELENDSKAPPERLLLWFSSHDLILTGWHLDHLRQLLRKGQSFTVTASDPRYLNLKPKECFVADVNVLNVSQAGQTLTIQRAASVE